MEIGALLAFVGAVIISAFLGLAAFIRSLKIGKLETRLDSMATEIQALRTALASRADRGPSGQEDREAAPEPIRPWGDVAREVPPESRIEETVPPSPEPQRSDERPPAPTRPDIPVFEQPDRQEKPAGKDLESTVGALWAVWVGGFALALGGIFLVAYSIEQGWLGPATRVSLGLLLGVGLAGLGEIARRRGQIFSVPGFEKANIPAILTAAGTIAAFASVYAAHALYALIGPAIAFLALGALAVCALAAALVHGLLLAAIGLAGSYAVPILISTDEPNIAALAIYILAVSVAAFGVARLRLWRWLAWTATAGLVAWGLLMIVLATEADRMVLFGYGFAAWILVFAIFVHSLYAAEPETFVSADRTATGALSGIMLLFLGTLVSQPYDVLSIAVLGAILAGGFATAFFYSAARYMIPGVMAAISLGYLAWSLPLDTLSGFVDDVGSSAGVSTPILEDIRRTADQAFIWTGLLLGIAGAGAGHVGVLRSASRALLATGGAGIALLLLSAGYLRLELLEPSLIFGASALALAAVFVGGAFDARTRLNEDAIGRLAAMSAYVILAVVGVALACAFVLERGALTIALALIAPATAFVYSRSGLAALRPLVVLAALAWVARIIWDPRIVGSDIGTVPVFNWLLYGYGIPAAGFFVSAKLLGRDRRDIWLEAIEGIALVAFMAAAALVGLHALDPPAMFSPIDTLAETALLSIVTGGTA
ncbi:MAG: DUF2339 domain-containing protein, partial [Pseudomonadota bacterium]